jgi:hypothetical protein
MTTATIDELTLADEPVNWADLGFDVSGDRALIGRVSVRLAGAQAGHGIVGWSLRGVASTELDGLPTTVSERPQPQAAGEHPNGVIAIDHVVAFSPDFERSVRALTAAGLDLRRVREQPTPAGAPRQAFFRLGEEILELIQVSDETPEQAAGRERPARFWGLATVTDLDRAAASFAPHAGDIRAAVQPGRRIVTLRRSAGLAIPVAMMSVADGPVPAR